MATQHQLNTLYDKYNSTDITFNKHIITSTRLIPGEIYIKVGTKNHTCILNSSSMIGARIILQANAVFFEELNQAGKWVSLRFAFGREDKHFPLSFFIKSKVESFNPFNANTPNLHLLNLKYAQRPPDDLIEILGSILEMNSNAKQRKNERIDMSAENLSALSIKSANTVLTMGNEKKSCIIRDISFYGAKVIASGIPDNLLEKDIKLLIQFNRDPGNCFIDGKIIRCEAIKAKDSFVLMGIHFNEERVPLDYIKILKEYLDKKDRIRIEPDKKE